MWLFSDIWEESNVWLFEPKVSKEPCGFFFTSVILIKDREVEKVKSHDLAYVQWFKFHNPAQDPLSELFQVTNDFYEGDEIISPRHFVSRCALLKPFRNSRYHFVVDLPASCSHK